MNLLVKLKLSKQRKKITIKYNTFEKATYDEYLVCALALRTLSEERRDEIVYEYIDDVTGEGSLNAHFKNLYNRIREFSQEQLEKVMTNSMLPILKIDDRNRYDYYPQLDASIFNNQVYEGDLGDYADLQKLLMIKEKIIEKNVENYKEESIKPDNYTVIIEERNDIKVKLLNKYIWFLRKLYL